MKPPAPITPRGWNRAASLLLALLGLLLPGAAAAASFANPLLGGADPWVLQHEGYYYFTCSTGWYLEVRRAPQLTGPRGLAQAAHLAYCSAPAPNNQNLWAPELHWISNRMYLYYAADNGTNANHRMHVAEGLLTNDSLTFTYKGKIYDPARDRWAIDGTVLQADDGALYFIWSGWPGSTDGRQNLYIAPMNTPWSLGGPRVLIASPSLAWESWILEGPTVLKRPGKVCLVYAANLSWTDDECLGLLVNTNGHYLDPASWTKRPLPVFQTFIATNGAVHGPGHASFTRSLDGLEDWIVYHAARASGSGWDRTIRMQRFTWDASNEPVFGTPALAGAVLQGPSGDDDTPARLEPAARGGPGPITYRARAPLPLGTNAWQVETASQLGTNGWSQLTNLPGSQYAVEWAAPVTGPSRFYRVRSAR